jgi:deltex
MNVAWEPHTHCAGHFLGTFVITYDIPAGIQSGSHPCPGRRYDGTRRVAYIPNAPQQVGIQLVHRLRYAFEQGLTFSIGTSLTSGRSDQVVWASIHHKTSRKPGPHGFPDLGYFVNCHEDLDALGVPSPI